MEHIPYKYLSRCSQEATALIVGKRGTPNPIAHRRTNILPFNQMRIGESLLFNKNEMIQWQWKLAKSTAIRYNREWLDMFRFVETDVSLEIVRIK